MWQCKKCKEYQFSTVKECHCKTFKIINQDGDEDEVVAMNERDAALKYAEKSNTDGDYYLMNSSAVISVDGKNYRISAEPDVHYSATAQEE